jgi:hypothetical protein
MAILNRFTYFFQSKIYNIYKIENIKYKVYSIVYSSKQTTSHAPIKHES